ncbi:MAG TPA: hypothetical protein PLV68_09205, partial [Ilumatobacteraceae bacterium]|nr:hypothetical protein [Ilumatobacteraceae bacterium]
MHRVPRGGALVIAVAAVFAAPTVLPDNYWLRFATSTLMLAALAQSLNITYAMSGYVPLGHLVFFGSGADGAAIIT